MEKPVRGIISVMNLFLRAGLFVLILSGSGCIGRQGVDSVRMADSLVAEYRHGTEFEKEAFPDNRALLTAKFPDIYESGEAFWVHYKDLRREAGDDEARAALRRAVAENGFSVCFIFPGCYELFSTRDLKELYEISGRRSTEVMKAAVLEPVDWGRLEEIREDRVRPGL